MKHTMKIFTSTTLKITSSLVFLAFAIIAVSILSSRLNFPSDLPKVTAKKTIVIDNVHLITMTSEDVQHNKQLLIEGGLIVAIRRAGTPTEAKYDLIDGNGSYILPGLIDMHVHALDRKYLVLSLAYGVTSVRNMGGYPIHLRWKEELAKEKWLGSNLFSAAPILNGSDYSDPFIHKVVTDPNMGRFLVNQYKSEGWDFIKVYESLDAEVYSAIIEEAEKVNIPVVGHPSYSSIDKNDNSVGKLVTFEHVEEIYDGFLNYTFDDKKLYKAVQYLKDNNVTVTPTLAVYDHLTNLSVHKHAFLNSLPTEYLNPFFKQVTDFTSGSRWLNASIRLSEHNSKVNDFSLHMVSELYKYNVNMVVGSDWGVMYTIPGIATHDEIALMSRAGMPPYEVLKAATINAARVLRVEHEIGSIREGMKADLVLVSENPLLNLDILREPTAVVKGGQYLDERFLKKMKESAKQTSGFFVSLGQIFDFLISK